MYNSPYFIPGYNPTMISPNFIRGAATNGLINGTRGMAANAINAGTRGLATNAIANSAKSTGLLSKLGTGLSGIKSINWGGLINNTSKTLGIINQTIPLVRQVGPMVTNMKSMLRVASLFKDETDTNPNIKTTSTTTRTQSPNINNNISNTNQTLPSINQPQSTPNNQDYSEAPTFFVAT